MAVLSRRRRASALAGVAALALVATGCGSSKDSGGSSSASLSPECQPYAQYHVDKKKTVSIYATIRDVEADKLQQSWKKFEDCTNIKIDYEGSGEFETQIKVRVDGGNAPDIAVFPQPGLLQTFVKAGKAKAAPQPVLDNINKNWSKDWAKYTTFDGKTYGAPLGSNVKSFVWYSPSLFKEKGYQIPKTWDEMMALSDKMIADGIPKAWCAGIESGDATGWPATDWLEDLMLRTAGPEKYDAWVNHTIPFNDPSVATALDDAGKILKNPKYVNGGYGDVKSIASTSFQDGGLPILDGKCAMHRQASFYANQWPEGTKVGEDGQVYAFYFPAADATSKPVLGGGEFLASFNDKPETDAVVQLFTSTQWVNEKAKIGDWITANKTLDVANVKSPVDKLSVQILQDPNAVFRFDGSDQMPAAVGAGSLWKGMVDWITGKSTADVLAQVEASWPKS